MIGNTAPAFPRHTLSRGFYTGNGKRVFKFIENGESEGKTYYEIIQDGETLGMQAFDSHIAETENRYGVLKESLRAMGKA